MTDLPLDELYRLVALFISMGIRKIRFTGGEPLTRPDLVDLINLISQQHPQTSMHITTNGTLLSSHKIESLVQAGITRFNISLDTLSPDKFKKLTGRDGLKNVLSGIQNCLEQKIPTKINSVILDGWNDNEIIALANLAKDQPLDVRFIEAMPFQGKQHIRFKSSAREILSTLEKSFDLSPVASSGSSAQVFHIQGFAGNICIIAGNSRTFCATCNRLRLTSSGWLKRCLYDEKGLNLHDLLTLPDRVIREQILNHLTNKAATGFGYRATTHSSMASIGG